MADRLPMSPELLGEDVTAARSSALTRVRTLDGRELSLELPEGSRAEQLKTRVRQEWGIPIAEMKLVDGLQVLGPEAHVLNGQSVTLVRTSRLPAFLARKGLDSINAVSRDGSTALHLAAAQGDAMLCLELLADRDFSGADAVDFLGNTALHRAADSHLPDVCCALVARAGAVQLAAANRNGYTALHLAALRGDQRTCRAMLAKAQSRAALASAADALGQTPADLAESGGHEALARALRSEATAGGGKD